ncbi:MAG: hypothetical protein KQH63_15460 [Desulfobulbaceae bacterium]|nr:hypothetical protein [Desulfobulbaceae bacterium]
MKLRKFSEVKLFAFISTLMFLVATNAGAGSLILDGAVDYIESPGTTGVTLASPVSLELSWNNDSIIAAQGVSVVNFNPDWGNTFNFTVGGLSLTSSHSHIGALPYATFVDGILDEFQLYWYDASVNGSTRNTWLVYVSGLASGGDTQMQWEFIDEYSATSAWFEGHLEFPPGAVPPLVAGDQDTDQDVDGVDLALWSAGGDLLEDVAFNFGGVW